MDGILIIDKPYGMTSHDVVNWLRKKYKQKKQTKVLKYKFIIKKKRKK